MTTTSVTISVLAFLAGLVGMEAIAWATHRYLMHGPLWSLHRSHHEPGRGRLEANDLFGLAFAAIAIGCFALAGVLAWRPLAAFAAGMTAYGFLYVLVHDGLVHRRFPFIKPGDRGYLRRLAQAHHLHHAVRERDGAVSFGFLIAPAPERLARRLADRKVS